MTTLQALKDLVNEAKSEKEALFKTRKNGVRYIPEEDKEQLVKYNYTILLGNKCIQIIKNGHSKQELIDGLKVTDWMAYSFRGRAYYTEKTLYENLAMKKKKSMQLSHLLGMQGDILNEIAYKLVDSLENTGMTMKEG